MEAIKKSLQRDIKKAWGRERDDVDTTSYFLLELVYYLLLK